MSLQTQSLQTQSMQTQAPLLCLRLPRTCAETVKQTCAPDVEMAFVLGVNRRCNFQNQE